MKVGTIVRLKVVCLENPIGAIGVVFNDYGDGSQVIFENGKYDGFHEAKEREMWKNQTEKDFFLKEIGFEPALADYRFRNVLKVEEDFRLGIFDIALKKGKIYA